LLIAALALSLIATSEAGNLSGAHCKQSEAQKKRLADEKQREKTHKAVQAVLDAKDANRDGSLSLDEYIAGEADATAARKAFEKYDRNKSNFLERSEIAAFIGK
jgi:Ca2+-binding EF-hand superfamily protein